MMDKPYNIDAVNEGITEFLGGEVKVTEDESNRATDEELQTLKKGAQAEQPEIYRGFHRERPSLIELDYLRSARSSRHCISLHAPLAHNMSQVEELRAAQGRREMDG